MHRKAPKHIARGNILLTMLIMFFFAFASATDGEEQSLLLVLLEGDIVNGGAKVWSFEHGSQLGDCIMVRSSLRGLGKIGLQYLHII